MEKVTCPVCGAEVDDLAVHSAEAHNMSSGAPQDGRSTEETAEGSVVCSVCQAPFPTSEAMEQHAAEAHRSM